MFAFDIFLSHSAADAAEADEVREILQRADFTVYCDRINDTELSRAKVNKATAERLRTRMRSCNSMLYVVSANAAHSKWMPWELGFFDGARGKILIYPVDRAALKAAKSQEYLQLFTMLKPGSLKEQLEAELAASRSFGSELAHAGIRDVRAKAQDPHLDMLRRKELFGPGDHAGTVGHGNRLVEIYSNPFDFEKITRANLEIAEAALRFWGIKT